MKPFTSNVQDLILIGMIAMIAPGTILAQMDGTNQEDQQMMSGELQQHGMDEMHNMQIMQQTGMMSMDFQGMMSNMDEMLDHMDQLLQAGDEMLSNMEPQGSKGMLGMFSRSDEEAHLREMGSEMQSMMQSMHGMIGDMKHLMEGDQMGSEEEMRPLMNRMHSSMQTMMVELEKLQDGVKTLAAPSTISDDKAE